MKKYFIIIIGVIFFTSCEEDLLIFDNENGSSIATFQDARPALLVFDPSSNTENIFTVSVSTVSSSDRAVSVSVDESSTIDPSFYTIETLNPVIPAGQFSTNVVITSLASDIFPGTGSTLVLKLQSVAGAEIVEGTSIDTYNVGFTVQCPSVDINAIVGEGANVLANELLTDAFGAPISAGGETRTILAGPGDNQITIVGGVGFNGSEDLILNINPESGSVSYAGPEGAVFFFNGPNPIAYTEVNGRVLTCIGLIELQIVAPFGAPFDSNTFNLQF